MGGLSGTILDRRLAALAAQELNWTQHGGVQSEFSSDEDGQAEIVRLKAAQLILQSWSTFSPTNFKDGLSIIR